MTSPRVLFAGRATLDAVYSLHQFPSEDTKVFARAMHVAPGGPATNAAITHALLGGGTRLITAIGQGPWAAPVLEELRRLGVAVVDLAAGTAYETPLTTVLVNEGAATRTIVNPPSYAAELRCPEVWDSAWGDAPRLALTDGFHLGETLPLLRVMHAGGIPICLDGGSWKAGTEELAAILSVAICSERFRVPGRRSDPDATIGWFAENGAAQVAITRGAKPILCWDRGRTFEIPVSKIEVIDTTGAGDVLHGAFCYQFALTGNFEEALGFAADIATRSCRGLGIRGWIEERPA